MQFTQLFLVNIVRSLSHQTACTLCFRESNNVTDRITFSHNHDQTVKTKGQTAVRRRTIFKSIHHKAEFLFCLLFGKTDSLENFVLDITTMDTDGTAADFCTIKYHIVSFGIYFTRIGSQHSKIFVT